MRFEDLINLLIPITFFVALGFERLFRAKELPKVRFWLLKGSLFFAFVGAVNSILPVVFLALIGEHAPLNLAWLGLVPGALLAFLVSDLVVYGVHRFMHRVPFVWRWSHQLHHSAERMDWPAFRTITPSTSCCRSACRGLPLACWVCRQKPWRSPAS